MRGRNREREGERARVQHRNAEKAINSATVSFCHYQIIGLSLKGCVLLLQYPVSLRVSAVPTCVVWA